MDFVSSVLRYSTDSNGSRDPAPGGCAALSWMGAAGKLRRAQEEGLSRSARGLWTLLLTLLLAAAGTVPASGQAITGTQPESGAPGTTARIYGSGFDGSTTVRIGGANAPVQSVSGSGTALTVTVPSGPEGTSDVTVDFGGQTETLTSAFDVLNGGSDFFAEAGAGLTNVDRGSSSWGDYDGDGDLDLVVTGLDDSFNPTATIYRNDGGGTFTAISAGLTGVGFGSSSSWGDYDGDGDLDLVVTGEDDGGNPTATIYRNDGGGTFTAIGAGLTGVDFSSSSWGDYDGDGDLDLIVTGRDNGGNPTATIYRNDGGGTFTTIGAGLTGVRDGSSSWGDYDGDGDLDLMVTGSDGSNRTATIYRNDGGGSFTPIGAGLTGVSLGSSSWGDYDGDGDLDLVVTGDDGSNPTTTIYRNDGGGSFTPISAGLTGVGSGSSSWGDYDGDGNLDLVVTGEDDGGNRTATIYRNDGGGTFTAIGAGLTGVEFSSSSWGDYDGDGDLDLVVTGFDDGSNQTATIYENLPQTVTEVRPRSGAPGTTARIYGSGFDGSATVRIGGANASVQSVSGSGTALRVTVPSGPEGTSDVTVDFGGQTKTLTSAFDVLTGGSDFFAEAGASLTGVDNSSSSWGDYDGDGDLDLVVTGEDDGGNPTTTIYRNDGGGTFTAIGAGLTGVGSGASSSWGDYDGDGDLDLVVTGENDGGNRTATIYRNDGGGTFTAIGAGLTGVSFGSSSWGDYDGDGDLDLVVTGDSGSGETAKIYRNEGGGTFTAIGAGLTGVGRFSSSSWGDYDGDGDLDLVVTGIDDGVPGNLTATIYRNDGGGTFTAIGAGLTGVSFGSSSWGDYDGDGDLDLVVTGQDDGNLPTATIYRNDGGGTFTEIGAGLTGVDFSSSSWGDYDGDGDLDLVVTGIDNGNNRTATIYRNDGGGTFTAIGAGLTGVGNGSSSLGDFNGDGNLDLVVTGDDGSNRTATIYENLPQTVTEVRPRSGAPGTTARIYGSGFDGSTTVRIGGANAPVQSVSGSGTALTVTVPSGPEGTSDVTVDFGGQTKTLTSAFDVLTGGSDFFAEVGAGLTGVVNGSSSWGDYDRDGDLDLVVTGYDGSNPTATIYRNDGSGTFTAIGAGLTGVTEGSSSWGDYDGDGDLDLVVTGLDDSFNPTATIYRNDGSGTFTAIGAGLTGVTEGSSSWGDYDGDGDLDLIVTGRDNGGNRTATIYRNDGGGTFTTIGAGLTGVGFGSSSSWGDYDGDGDLDLMVTGSNGSDETATIYRNDGSGTFTAIGAGLTGVTEGSSSWGDYDGDGDLDLIVTGRDNGGNRTATIYRNDGGGTFTTIGAGLTGVDQSSSSWGDYDGDGDLDLVVTGDDGSNDTAAIYRNDGGGTFTAIGAGLKGVGSGSSSWGDYDGDGDLDLVVTGFDDGSNQTATIYENAYPGVVYVDKGAGGASNGTSWADAYTDLQTAIDNAGANSEIWVAEGTYKPDSEGDSFTITGSKDGIEVYGGFESGDAFGDRAPREHRTILSGDLVGDDTDPDGDGIIEDADPNQDGTPENLSGTNAEQILLLDGGNKIGTNVAENVTAATVIDGIVVTAGHADGTTSTEEGAGVFCDGDGSGNECSPTLRNVVFAGNAASFNGGALANVGEFDGTSSPQITNATFTGNAVGSNGGAILNSGLGGTSRPQITNATFTNNAAGDGGAIFNDGTGGVSSPQITNATFTGNAAGNGGAIANNGSSGGGDSGTATPQITNAILWGNSATSSGDEMYNTGSGATPALSHTIIEGGISGISENNSSSTTDDGGNLDKDPQFYASGTLAGPDGTLRTVDDSVNLAAGSPALDAGDNTALDTTGDGTRDITTDITGASRVQELDSYDAAAVNIGAYEASPGGYSRRIVGTDGTGNDADWRMLSVPAANAARGDLGDDVTVETGSGDYTIYRWEGGQWAAQTQSGDALPRGFGFILYLFDDSQEPLTSTGTVLGVPDGGADRSTDVTLDAGIKQSEKFEVLGNPYDAAYDLGGLAGGDLPGAGFQATVQVWDPNAQQFKAFTQGDVGDEIPAWNSFILERTEKGSGQSSLTFSASGKLGSSGSLLGSKRAALASKDKGSKNTGTAHAEVGLQMTVTDGEDTLSTDRATLWLDERAEAGWDGYDATDMPPPKSDSYATATFPIEREGSTAQRMLAAEPYSSGQVETSAPLSVKATGLSGTGTLSWPEDLREEVPDNWAVRLRDTRTGETTDLRTEAHTFSLNSKKAAAKAGEARFRLEVTSSPLPVELARFEGTATEDGVVLQWKTASETGNAGFGVQRQRLGEKDWKKVAFVDGSGTTSQPKTYRLADTELPYAADTLRYRLRQVDTDGSATLTDPIAVGRKQVDELELLGTYPNPAREQATVRYGVPESVGGTVRLRLYDVLGRQVRTAETEAQAGRHKQRLDVSGLANGVYFLRLRAGGNVKTQKLTVVR